MAHRGPGRDHFEGLAADTGFRIGELEKAYRLVEVLGRFQDDPLLRDTLALKGGTACTFSTSTCVGSRWTWISTT